MHRAPSGTRRDASDQAASAEDTARGNSSYLWEPHHTLPHWKRTGYGNQLQHFATCILNGTDTIPSLWDGWRNLVVGQCILEACATRKGVEGPPENQT